MHILEMILSKFHFEPGEILDFDLYMWSAPSE